MTSQKVRLKTAERWPLAEARPFPDALKFVAAVDVPVLKPKASVVELEVVGVGPESKQVVLMSAAAAPLPHCNGGC